MHPLAEQLAALGSHVACTVEGLSDKLYVKRLTLKEAAGLASLADKYELKLEDPSAGDTVKYVSEVLAKYVADADGNLIFEDVNAGDLPVGVLMDIFEQFQAVNNLDRRELEKN